LHVLLTHQQKSKGQERIFEGGAGTIPHSNGGMATNFNQICIMLHWYTNDLQRVSSVVVMSDV